MFNSTWLTNHINWRTDNLKLDLLEETFNNKKKLLKLIKFKKTRKEKSLTKQIRNFIIYFFLVRNLDRELEGLLHEIHIIFKNKVNIIQRKEESICVKELYEIWFGQVDRGNLVDLYFLNWTVKLIFFL